jgi:hypothetical protein
MPAQLDELEWARNGGGGALVTRSSLSRRDAQEVTELPLTVMAGAAPGDLRRGDRVDVWVGPGPGDDPGQEAELVLGGVRVVSSGAAGAIEGAPSRTVLVGVPDDKLSGAVVSTVAAGHVTLARVR